jgi:hypothetical protein
VFYELCSLGGLTRFSKAAVQCSHCNVCIGLDEEDLQILLSLAHGEIVQLKVPSNRAPGGGLIFEHRALRRVRLSFSFP